LIEQGYLAIEAHDQFAEIRLYRIAKRYVLTVKQGRGTSRVEKRNNVVVRARAQVMAADTRSAPTPYGENRTA
jgi:hypothetical protein